MRYVIIVGVAISAVCLTACAALPAQRESQAAAQASGQPKAGASADWWAHQKRLAAEVAVLAAMGGENPNVAYRALIGRACQQRNRITEVTQRASADADCATFAGIHSGAATARNGGPTHARQD